MTIEEECRYYGISTSDCSENAILAMRRPAISEQPQSESVKVSNAHVWVVNNNTSTTAFVV